jgi:hypothetical protein
MTDIADKIYAATGLTLNAEAAAKIGKMIQVENEKLQATLNFAVTSHHEAVNTVISLVAERDTLRAAICEWAASIYGYEGVLFLEGLKHEKFINSILDAERDRVEGEQKE